jgi:hypothetical protein
MCNRELQARLGKVTDVLVVVESGYAATPGQEASQGSA